MRKKPGKMIKHPLYLPGLLDNLCVCCVFVTQALKSNVFLGLGKRGKGWGVSEAMIFEHAPHDPHSSMMYLLVFMGAFVSISDAPLSNVVACAFIFLIVADLVPGPCC